MCTAAFKKNQRCELAIWRAAAAQCAALCQVHPNKAGTKTLNPLPLPSIPPQKLKVTRSVYDAASGKTTPVSEVVEVGVKPGWKKVRVCFGAVCVDMCVLWGCVVRGGRQARMEKGEGAGLLAALAL